MLRNTRLTRKWLFLPAVFIAFSCLAGAALFWVQAGGLYRQAEISLRTVAQLKVAEVAAWMGERRADATVIQVSEVVRQYLLAPASLPLQEATTRYLEAFRRAYRYQAIVIFDGRGERQLVIAPNLLALRPSLPERLPPEARPVDIVMSDLHRHAAGEAVCFGFLCPIGDTSAPVPLGFALLRIDPEEFLYPSLRSWPTPSESAESLLLRGEAEEVVVLNTLRHRGDAPLTLRLGVTPHDAALARAAIKSEEGLFKGGDYRGVAVTAAVARIPGTPWTIVSKVDQQELYGPARGAVLMVATITALAALAAMLGGALVRWQKGLRLAREDIAAREKTLRRLHKLSELQASLHAPASLGESLQKITAAVIAIFGADFARIWLTKQGDLCERGCMHAAVIEGPHVCRHRDKCLHLLASSGRYVHLDGAIHRRVPFGCYKIGRIAAGMEESFLTNKVTTDALIHDHAWAAELGLVSFAGYRIGLADGGRIGVLGLFSQRPIDPEEDALLKTLANLIAPAIEAAENRQRLLESSEKYRGIFDDSVAAIYVCDASGRFLDANQAGIALLGYGREELLDLTLDAVAASPGESLFPYDGKLDGGRLVNHEHRLRRKDGAVITVLSNTRLLASGGVVHGLQSTLFDISRRKQAEEDLRQSRRLLRLVLDTVPQAVFWKDAQCVYLGCNKTFALSAGLADPGQIVGRSDFDLPWPEDESQAYRADDLAVMESGEAKMHIIEPLQQANGVRLWIDTSKIPLLDEEGRPLGVFGIYEDITQRRRMEEELQARNEELVRFVYTVSHDLKSPLVTIQTFLGFLVKDLAGNDRQRVEADIGYMDRAAVKMHDLLEGLLELSRVGRKRNPPEDVPFSALVRSALDAVAGQIAERGVEVVITGKDVVVHGDRLRLTEIFQNLVDNAVKFMGEQPAPRIEIGVEISGEEVVFFVRDNGMGIDPRHQDKLFGLFEKLHPGTPGTGMGLALIKRIVEVHKGRIWVESAGPGQGAVFRFTIQGVQS